MKRLLLFLTVSICFSSLYGAKRALVIGISEYRDVLWMKPRISAERDIAYVCEILNKTGFSSKNINILKNQQATKKAIVDEFKSLIAVSNPGDIIYIHFSGHGQLMTDVDGDEKPNVFGQRWDESWIPYDASFKYDKFDHGNLHLCDDEVGALLTDLKIKIGDKGRILVVVDACHSGDATRQNDDVDGFYDTVGDSTTYSTPYLVTRGTSNNFIIETKEGKESSNKETVENWITISACGPYQVNSEMRDSQGLRIGMLTYGIYTMLEKLTEISNSEFADYLIKFMKQNKHPKSVVGQNPQITGLIEQNNISNTFSTKE